MSTNNRYINKQLSKLYQANTAEFLTKYCSAFCDSDMPNRINEFGIIDEDRYDTHHKILVVGKETNGWSNKDFNNGKLFRDWLKSITVFGFKKDSHTKKHPRMWYNIGRWIEIIQNPCTDIDILANIKTPILERIATVAFTNINKVRGNNQSGKEFFELSKSSIAKTLFQEEIRILQPNILLCCGVADICKDYLSNSDIKIISMPHPTARKSNINLLKDLKEQL